MNSNCDHTRIRHPASRETRQAKLIRQKILTFCLLGMIALLSGCRFFGRDTEAAVQPPLLRTPHPTFTPTTAEAVAPVAPPAQVNAAQGEAGPAPQNPAPAVAEPMAQAGPLDQGNSPRAVVNSPLVNIRTGPGVDYEVVATVERGAEYDITGRDSSGEWWAICCVEGQGAWVNGEYVDTDGAVDSVAITERASGDSEAEAVGGPAAETPPPAEALSEDRFELESQEQFPEAGLVRIYLYVYGDSGALAGYGLKVTRNGVDLPVTSQSFGGQPAFTWPFQDARQRYQNLKVELPGEPPAGDWTIQLVDSQSQPVGPPASFTLRENDPNQELYVRYQRR